MLWDWTNLVVLFLIVGKGQRLISNSGIFGFSHFCMFFFYSPYTETLNQGLRLSFFTLIYDVETIKKLIGWLFIKRLIIFQHISHHILRMFYSAQSLANLKYAIKYSAVNSSICKAELTFILKSCHHFLSIVHIWKGIHNKIRMY